MIYKVIPKNIDFYGLRALRKKYRKDKHKFDLLYKSMQESEYIRSVLGSDGVKRVEAEAVEWTEFFHAIENRKVGIATRFDERDIVEVGSLKFDVSNLDLDNEVLKDSASYGFVVENGCFVTLGSDSNVD